MSHLIGVCVDDGQLRLGHVGGETQRSFGVMEMRCVLLEMGMMAMTLRRGMSRTDEPGPTLAV